MNHRVGIAFSEALQWVQDAGRQRPTATTQANLREARGRVLRESIIAPMSLPSFENSAMDGFALRGCDLQSDAETCLALVATQFAGTALGLALREGECARITTGAPLPAGADTVVIKENARVDDGRVTLMPGTSTGANVRHVGEDVRVGDRLFDSGSTLRSAGLGLLASLGHANVAVAQRPSVAVFTSGDELRAPGTSLAAGEIYDSNRVLLQALLAEEGIDTLSWPALPDDPERMRSALHDAAQAYDVVLTCGGVSAGEKDLLPGLLQTHGRVHFWKVMMRPGMPVLFGEWERALFLGLPGNPVSVLATFRRLAAPLLDAMQGRADRPPSLRARLLQPVRKSHARLEFRRALLECSDDGILGVSPHPAEGSHQQKGAADSNALLVLPEACRELASGEIAEVESYGPILRASPRT